MEPKIQELTDKLYKEGVEKGEAEANRLIEEAQDKRKLLIEEAQVEAKEIAQKAIKDAENLKKNTESELKLYASQAVEALKSEVANMITDKLATNAVQAAFNQNDFMSQLIMKLVSEWPKSEKLILSSSDADNLKMYFEKNSKILLDKGLTIEQVNGKKNNFSIGPADGTYKINFGEEEFVEYFKEFLRPQLIDLLF